MIFVKYHLIFEKKLNQINCTEGTCPANNHIAEKLITDY